MNARIDASVFDPALIAPEVREFNAAMLSGMADLGWVFPPESATALRDALAKGPEPYRSDAARTITVPSSSSVSASSSASASAGGIPVRVIPAASPTGVFVHCHSGGWTLGSADGQDTALERIVRTTGMTVASIEYRRAPEHPYPAPLDDCEQAARWLLDNAERELGSGRLLIGGESAGANLALCTALRIGRDRPSACSAGSGGDDPPAPPRGSAFRAVALYYGNYDLTMTPSARRSEEGVLITRASLDWFFDQYVPDASRRDDPDISPLYADLRGLPPTMLAIGTADSLVDDTTFLACRLLASGVECELVTVPGAEHAFDMVPLPSCQEAVATVDAFLARHAAKS